MGRLEDLRINAYLSEVARGYRNNAFVADVLFPTIYSEKEKEFKDLQICQQNNLGFISMGIKSSNNNEIPKFRILGQEKVTMENLSKLLERIRKRKEKLINKQKKANRERIRKLKEK